MLVVCVSHFLDEVALSHLSVYPGLIERLAAVCRIATPTFFLVSGIMIGYLCRTMGDRFNEFRLHLLDKALHLLTAGHLFIAVATAGKSGLLEALGVGYVTDTLALCAMGSVLLIPRLSWRQRLYGGCALYSLCWFAWYFWKPTTPLLAVLQGMLLGPQADGTEIFFFPILPWVGIHLVGGCLGERLGRYPLEELYQRASRELGTLAAGAFLVAAVVRTCYELVIRFSPASTSATLYQFASPYQKYPPGPAYLLFFGGLALLLIAGMLYGTHRRWFQSSMRIAEIVGRNSLLAFLLQYVVYYAVLHWVVTKTNVLTPATAVLFLILSIWVLVAVIVRLDRCDVQRWWTVGLPGALKRWTFLRAPLRQDTRSHLGRV